MTTYPAHVDIIRPGTYPHWAYPSQPERKPMTLAIGIRCVDGCVLAADSEYSYGGSLLKTRGSKLGSWTYPDGSSLVCAGAGEWDIMRAFFDASMDDVRSLASAEKTLPRVKETLENRLKRLYRGHIYSMPSKQQDISGANFLVAFRTPDRKIALWVAHRTILNEVTIAEPESIGLGISFGSYLSQALYRMEMLTGEAAALAAIIIYEACKNVQFVGGRGKVLLLPTGGEPGYWLSSDDIDHYGEAFWEMLTECFQPVLFACFKRNEPAALNEALAELTKRANDVRSKFQTP